VSVLIPAAGNGERMGMGPKALVPLAGRPLVEWVVDKARQVGHEVLVACAPGMAAPAGSIRVEGGATRQESVQRLAERASGAWVLLWDAASPFSSVALARQVLAAASATGAATTCLPSEVPCLVLEGDRVQQAYPSGATGWSLTPQCYRRELLCEVTRRAAEQGWSSQSTVQLVLRAGHAVVAVKGEKLGIKLTTPDDWVLAQALHAQLSR
jgi:2-C-methyl-D-erythritol 4-phosphate cytidylyltransferase